MIRNKLIAITLTSLLAACASNAPTSTQDVLSEITVTKDNFDGTTTIQTPIYGSSKGFTDEFPVEFSFRAFYKDSERQFIQLFIATSSDGWAHYYKATGQDGVNLKLIVIDKLVDSKTFKTMVLTRENLGLTIPLSYLNSMSKSDFSIKLYGKKRTGNFAIPNSTTKAFLKKLNCFETNNCN